jgi:transcriptional regulator with PAS, ATPase and Fis domain
VKLYEEELINLRSTRYTFESIIGTSASITALIIEARRAADTHYPVLISGESGTGKELFAQAIHHASPRRVHPFVRINCAAIRYALQESGNNKAGAARMLGIHRTQLYKKMKKFNLPL